MCVNRYVFISYSSKEIETAEKICSYLEFNHVNCWIAPRNVEAGANYASQIVNAIKKCEVMVMLASENTNVSGHVSNEVSIAFDNKIPIIPLRLEKFEFSDEYLYFLGRKHWINAYEDWDLGLAKLKETIFSLTDAFPKVNKETEKLSRLMMTPTGIKENQSYLLAGDSKLSREEMVHLLVEKSKKYSHNIFSKINTEEKYIDFMKNASAIFSVILSVYNHNRIIDIDGEYIDIIINQLSLESCDVTIQVQGLPGSAKNMLLQLAFYRMLREFKDKKSNCLPFYISSNYYEKLTYDSDDSYNQMREIIEKDFGEYFNYIGTHRNNIIPVLFLDAVKEHIVSKVAPENVIYDLWKSIGCYNRIVSIDVGLIKNRMRLKRVIPIAGDTKGYSFITRQVPIDDTKAVLTLISAVVRIYDYDVSSDEILKVIKSLKYPVIDVFLVRLVAEEILSSYDSSAVTLTDMYEKLALSEMGGDAEQLKVVAKELFEYVFVQTYNYTLIPYSGKVWSLPHKHNTYLEFLIAYYYVDQIEHYQDNNEYSFFSTMLTSMSNQFIVAFLRDNYALQENFLHFITGNYEVFNLRQKSNAVYWLGRITYSNLAREAITMLTKEFTKYKSIVKNNNCFSQDNCDNHFLFRAICTGLLFQGQANMMDEYLSIVVANDVANAINRGAAIEYFGDNYQMGAHDSYYLDTDLSIGEQAIKILNSRIDVTLSSNTGKFVENNLVTMLTLLQARIQNKNQILKFDIKPYVKQALEYLRIYQTRPQNVVSRKLLYYFKSVQEDFELYLMSDFFDIGTMMYNKYRNLKLVKRYQWVNHNIEDPESVSEHMYSAWIMGMFFLPEEYNTEGYNKREILDMLLVHDMAEAVLGTEATVHNDRKEKLQAQNEVLKKLFLKGTYPDIANLTYYYNVWTGYYNGLNINARTARDFNLVQTVYTFCEYCRRFPECFSKDEIENWIREKANLKTELGYQLFDRLITNNRDFKELF